MPFRLLTELDLATREKMTAAYDAVCQQLGIQASDPLTAKLAATIVAAAKEGLVDSEELKVRGLAALQAPAVSQKSLFKRVTNAASVPPMSPHTRS